jgi:addiction module RelE/StbE family toxin
MPRIEWRSQAQDDLEEIFRYVVEFQPAAAWRLRDAIMRQVESLTVHPALGRAGRIPGTRELVVPSSPYLVAYTFDSRRDVVQVLAVIHGARLWPAEF